MQSYVGTNTAANMSRHVSRWEWSFPDGQTKSGAVVQWSPTATCTAQNVSLTAYGDDGTSNAATYSVTVLAIPAFSRTRYVRSDGADSGGSHDGTVNDAAHAWLTLEKAFSDWRNVVPTTLGVIYLNAGQTIAWTGANDGTHSPNPDYGPLLITKTGAGANPILSVTNTADVALAADGSHDPTTLWSDLVIMDGIDIAWTAAQAEGGGIVDTQHANCVYRNATSTKGKVNPRNAPFTLLNVTGTLGQEKAGLGKSGAGTCYVADTCTSRQNGNDASLHHQFYLTSANESGVIDCIADQNGATAYSGIKVSGSTRIYLGRNTCTVPHVGYDLGGNAGEQNVDMVLDAPIIDTPEIVAFYTNFLLRCSIRNARVYAGCSQEFYREQSNSAVEFVDTLDIYHASANLITGQVGDFISNSGTVSWFTGVTIKNSAFVKANAGVFYTLQYAADVSKVAIDYNVYWRVGGTPDSDATFASVAGVTKTFAQWQALGLDTHSKFRDPLFTAAKNLLPTALSPCIGAGAAIGVVTKDVVGTARSATAPTIGAFEVSSTPPPVVPALVSHFDKPSLFALIKNTIRRKWWK